MALSMMQARAVRRPLVTSMRLPANKPGLPGGTRIKYLAQRVPVATLFISSASARPTKAKPSLLSHVPRLQQPAQYTHLHQIASHSTVEGLSERRQQVQIKINEVKTTINLLNKFTNSPHQGVKAPIRLEDVCIQRPPSDHAYPQTRLMKLFHYIIYRNYYRTTARVLGDARQELAIMLEVWQELLKCYQNVGNDIKNLKQADDTVAEISITWRERLTERIGYVPWDVDTTHAEMGNLIPCARILLESWNKVDPGREEKMDELRAELHELELGLLKSCHRLDRLSIVSGTTLRPARSLDIWRIRTRDWKDKDDLSNLKWYLSWLRVWLHTSYSNDRFGLLIADKPALSSLSIESSSDNPGEKTATKSTGSRFTFKCCAPSAIRADIEKLFRNSQDIESARPIAFHVSDQPTGSEDHFSEPPKLSPTIYWDTIVVYVRGVDNVGHQERLGRRLVSIVRNLQLDMVDTAASSVPVKFRFLEWEEGAMRLEFVVPKAEDGKYEKRLRMEELCRPIPEVSNFQYHTFEGGNLCMKNCPVNHDELHGA